jgi:16S rRNA (uracil1498-N3)-methyltransferase
MRISRIHVAALLTAESELRLPAGASRHLLRVLRLRAGAEVTLFDGRGGEYGATLLGADGPAARLQVGAHRELERESPLDCTLLQGVSRGERMDLIIQKAVELGVTRVVPVMTEFAVVKLDAAQAAKRQAHWQGIAISACEQCGRNRVPEVAAPASLTTACASLDPGGTRLLLAPDAAATLAAAASGAQRVVLLIGPEGGLSDAEHALAARRQFVACRLGPRVLRTETAPLAALALLQAIAGDLGR